MGTAILSPCLFDNRFLKSYDEKMGHALQLGELLKYLRDNFEMEIDDYRKAPYEGYCMDIPRYNNYVLDNYIMTNVYAIIQKMINKKNYIDLTYIEPAECITPMNLPDTEHKDAFLRYINYVKENEKIILFIGNNNLNFECPFKFKFRNEFIIPTSTEVKIELSDMLVAFIKNSECVNDIFPRKAICDKYNKYLKERITNDNLDQAEKMALFQEIGNLVALYNGYKRDVRLSKINSSKNAKRSVYKRDIGEKYYLSIDYESGGFEVFDVSFVHLGQYGFCGNKIKQAEPLSHKLNH